MPDLITHTLVSHLLRRPLDWRSASRPWQGLRPLFYLGVLLPDILTRPFYIIFPVTKTWTIFLHTPAGALLACLLLTRLLREDLRRSAFFWIAGGALTHFALDALQKQVTGNNFWLFPFSWKNFSLPLLRPEDFMALIPLFLGLTLVLEAAFFVFRRRTPFTNR